VCGDWDLQLFYDLGWLREVNVDEREIVPMDEASQQQCDMFDDAEFQRRWVEEQVYRLVIRDLSIQVFSFWFHFLFDYHFVF
jgi:hypothetical protein